MKDGDQNTWYFHNKASQRYKRNWVKGLRNSLGLWCEGDDQVTKLFIDYYKKLFTSSNPNHVPEVLETIRQVVIKERNQQLLVEFTKVEVDLALKQMSPVKALGSDGMPPLFY